jgi:hypothetical protein
MGLLAVEHAQGGEGRDRLAGLRPTLTSFALALTRIALFRLKALGPAVTILRATPTRVFCATLRSMRAPMKPSWRRLACSG